MTRTLTLIGLAAVAVGCAADTASSQATISPQCSADDAVCTSLGLNAPIAAGTTLDVDVAVTSPGSATPLLVLDTARPEVATVDGYAVTAHAGGLTGLLVSTEGRLVIDFIHIWVAKPNRLGIHRVEGDISATQEVRQKIELLVGDEVVLAVMPYRDNEQLLGNATSAWAADGAAVTLLSEGVEGRRRVVAREVGLATVATEMLGLTRELEIEVMP